MIVARCVGAGTLPPVPSDRHELVTTLALSVVYDLRHPWWVWLCCDPALDAAIARAVVALEVACEGELSDLLVACSLLASDPDLDPEVVARGALWR